MVGIGVLALAIVSGGLTVWLLNRGDEGGPNADRAGGLNVMPASIDNGISVLGEPGRVWTFEASEAVNGSTFSPLDPHSEDEFYSPTAVAVGHTLVTAVSTYDDEGNQSLTVVGVGEDSEQHWTHANSGGCWDVDGAHLVCVDEDGHLELLDPDTGRTTATSSLRPSYGVDPTIHQNTLYVLVDGDDGEEYRLHALDLVNLKKKWDTVVPIAVPEASYASYGGITVSAGVATLTYANYETGGGDVVVEFDQHTGAVVSTTQADDDSYTEGSWTIALDYDGDRFEVRRSGDVIFEHSGSPWSSQSRTQRHIVDGRVGADGTLYDVQSGEAIWSRQDLRDQPNWESTTWNWSTDGEQVLARSIDEINSTARTVVLDAATGETEWTVEDEYYSEGETRDAFIDSQSVSESEIESASWTVQVRNRDDGSISWSRDLSDLLTQDDRDNGQSGGVYLTDGAIWAIAPSSIRGFSEFPTTGGSGSNSDDDTAYVTACGAPPEFVPTASETAYGGVAITYTVKATCKGGQWLNHSQLSVPFVVGGYSYASGYFDFSEEPYWIPEGGEDLELVYPFENTQVPEPEIEKAIEDDGGTGNVVQVPCEPGPDNTGGAVPSDPSYGADPGDPTTADGAPDESTDEDRDETALEALQRIADEDTDSVDALGTTWTAQLSSKQPGTADDGKVYDSYDDILALHLQHRARYPESLLVYSNDWAGSFGPTSRDYWVTLSGQSEATTRPILRWCKDEGWGLGDCWAKRLQHSGDPDLNTDKDDPDERNN